MRHWNIAELDQFQLKLAKRAYLVTGYRCLDAFLRGMAIIMQDQPGGTLKVADPLVDGASDVMEGLSDCNVLDPTRLVDGLGANTRVTINQFASRIWSYHEKHWAIALASQVAKWSDQHNSGLTNQLLYLAFCLRTQKLVASLSEASGTSAGDEWQAAVSVLNLTHFPVLLEQSREGWNKRHELLVQMANEDIVAFERYVDNLNAAFLEHWQFVQESVAATLFWEYYAREEADGGLAPSQ